ncbi:sigma-70 family RNA polymerase sigma factor [Sphingomonas aurantiaca]|jgi:RNA polymerase sigma-32 factor|uniref:sigma-70 family RNA polymerase sigma factor n=1 Tax=Sphingomonas aurantiaca TaxID=185949 RepID=UPI002FDF6AC9
MSKTTIALEAAVAAVLAQLPNTEGLSAARQRANIDKAFTAILKLIAPRIRHFIRQYGLVSHWEDAEQCCAIAVHRALQGYDPAKAQFTTFVNWQIRGELQSLRFRLMTDQRPSAKKVDATTVSLHAVTSSADGEEATLESILEDEGALARTESAASDYLAHAATRTLVDAYVEGERAAAIEVLRKRPRPKRTARPEPIDHRTAMLRRPRTHGLCPIELAKLEERLVRDKQIVELRVFDAGDRDAAAAETGVTKERVRQITKRATRSLAELAGSDPRFAMMAEYRKPKRPASAKPLSPATATPVELPSAILPALGQLHNTLSRVVAIAPDRQGLGGTPRSAGDPALLPETLSVATATLAAQAPGNRTRH